MNRLPNRMKSIIKKSSGEIIRIMKRYFSVLLIQILSLLFFNDSYSQSTDLLQEAQNITKGGYSVFDQTMVDMPWTEIEKSISSGATVFLPVGVIEEHGPHMCSGSDIYQAYISAKLAKKELDKKGITSLIAPPFYWGIADIANGFPGTFTVSESTMKSLLSDIFVSLNRWGVKNVIIFNGHGEPKHQAVLHQSMIESHKKLGINIYLLVDKNNINKYQNSDFKNCIIPVDYKPPIPIEYRFDNCHADCIETGNMAGFFPRLVDTVMARMLQPTNFRGRPEFKSPADVSRAWEKDARNITPLGYFGDPASFDYKKSLINYMNDSKSEAEAIILFFKKE